MRERCLILMLGSAAVARAETQTIARCGAGFLEEVDGYRVLHVKGDPYEMGYQQGALLRDDIRELVRLPVRRQGQEGDVRAGRGQAARPQAGDPGDRGDAEEVHARAVLRGDARDGRRRGLDVQDIIVANFIPEMFHCSGFALSGSATKDGTLYHGRILDYGCDWGLQEHAVLTVAEPEGRSRS